MWCCVGQGGGGHWFSFFYLKFVCLRQDRQDIWWLFNALLSMGFWLSMWGCLDFLRGICLLYVRCLLLLWWWLWGCWLSILVLWLLLLGVLSVCFCFIWMVRLGMGIGGHVCSSTTTCIYGTSLELCHPSPLHPCIWFNILNEPNPMHLYAHARAYLSYACIPMPTLISPLWPTTMPP